MPFTNVKKRFGFGCMRMPLCEDKRVDREKFTEMVDAFLAAGYNYFDTAHGYLGGESEPALRDCLTSRYPREAYVLTDKLSTYHFEREDEIRPLFFSQLAATGVDYFDFYLMHAQDRSLYKKYRECRAYEIALELQREGYFRHFGISYHDGPELLREILVAYPEIEVVQIQLNYADYEDKAIRSREVYEVCCEFGKDVIVMEPVKGGSLVNLPEEALAVLTDLGGTPASYALRFAADLPRVRMVLSGMGTMDMVRENTALFQDPAPLTAAEREALSRVVTILRSRGTVACTACRYCTDGCPQGIDIPTLFACYNSKKIHGGWTPKYYYRIKTADSPTASQCIGCGACEDVCPQHLPIRELLGKVAELFE